MKSCSKWIPVAGIVLVAALLIAKQSTIGTAPFRGADGKVLPGSTAALEKVRLGGMDQWIQVRGRDAANPVLLWLHGGPGSAQMPVASYNRDLETGFVVVHWDQRGAGKSNPSGFDESTLTFDQFLADAHELTQVLKQRFHQEKIYLVGHSWGTVIGSRLAARYPEDYHAYIAVSQVVDGDAANAISYEWLQGRIAQSGSQADLEKLAAFGPPPYRDHAVFVSFMQMVDAYGGGFDVPFSALAWAALRAPEYGPYDYYAWIQGSSRGSGPMWNTPSLKTLFADVPRQEVPVYFFSGRNDYNTPLALVEEYMQALDAPQGKHLVIFEHSAHTPFLGEPVRFGQEMMKVKAAATPSQLDTGVPRW